MESLLRDRHGAAFAAVCLSFEPDGDGSLKIRGPKLDLAPTAIQDFLTHDACSVTQNGSTWEGERDRKDKRETEPASETTDFAHQLDETPTFAAEAQRDDFVEELKVFDRQSMDATVMATSFWAFADIVDEATPEELKGLVPMFVDQIGLHEPDKNGNGKLQLTLFKCPIRRDGKWKHPEALRLLGFGVRPGCGCVPPSIVGLPG